MKTREILLSVAYFAIAAAFDLLHAGLPAAFFAFPVNAALAALLAGGLYVLNREFHGSRAVVMLSSVRTTAVLLCVFAVCCLVVAFQPDAAFTGSCIFNASLLLVAVNLYLAVLRYRGRRRFRFLMNHIGILLFICGLSLGSADMRKLKVRLEQGESTEIAYDNDGVPASLGYEMRLDRFTAGFHASGVPSSFCADISVDGVRHRLEVNSPWRRSWKEDVYLSGYDMSDDDSLSAVIEIVVQPWKYIVLLGCLMMMLGSVLLIFGGRR